MSMLKEFNGREFPEGSWRYETKDRMIAGQTPNKVWLYTVDVCEDVESGKTLLRLVRWVARKENGDSPTKVWRFRGAYNLRSLSHWDAISRTVDALLHEDIPLKETGILKPHEIDSQIIQSKDEEINALESAVERGKTALVSHKAQLRKSKQRIKEMKSHIGDYRETLKKFKTLVEKPSTNERRIHGFIDREKPFWIFGLEYVAIRSKVAFPPPPSRKKYEFDLMLDRFDRFMDLVELKGPNENLFSKRTKHRSKINQSLSVALGQVIAYLSECDKIRRKTLVRPNALIVIGNKKTDDPSQRRLLASHMSRVEILTYTDLLKHGEQLLKHIEGKKT